MTTIEGKEKFINRLQAPPYKFADGSLEYGARHINPDGSVGGMVGEGCIVEGTCWVDYEAEVFNYAQVRGNVHIDEYGIVCGFAELNGDINVPGSAIICGDAKLIGEMSVGFGTVIETGTWCTDIGDYTMELSE
jgi:carbonic anhydrase/acetyltransferase-like protein (isoleucine patch superfamily)